MYNKEKLEDKTNEQLSDIVLEVQDKWLRSEAEIYNVRNRAKKDIEDNKNYSLKKFAGDMVDTADNLKRMIDLMKNDNTGFREGIESTYRSFLHSMEKHGVTMVEPSIGDVVDFNYHNVVSVIPSHAEKNSIIEVFTPVWLLNGRLLRAGNVAVSQG